MKQLSATLLILILFSIYVKGQEKLQFSLSEAQNYAIEHNKTIQNARNDLALSEQKIKETIAQGLPQIDATYDWVTYFNYEMEFDFSSSTESTFTTEQIQEASSQTLNTFGSIPSAGLDQVTEQDLYNYQAGYYYYSLLSATLPATTIKMTSSSTANIQLGQLIFSGQYWAGIKVARLGKKIAEQGLDNSILDIKESITTSYYMALVTQQSIETFRQSIENLNTIKGHNEMMFKTGMAEQIDIDQLSIQVTMLENTLRSMNRGLDMVYSMMKFQLGIKAADQITLTENLNLIITNLNPKSEIGQFDVNNNLNYRMLKTQEEISKKMLDIEKWNFAPTVTGYYIYNQKMKTTGFDMTPTNMAGISMNLPIFSSGSRKAKIAQAKIELTKTQINKSMVKDQLELQQEQLRSNLKTAIENYDSQKANVNVAKRVFENINNKYRQGMASSLDLTQSNNNYLQAESNFIQSTMTLLQAKVAIDKLYNQL
jgi:outer membrane protein TolC